MNFWLINIAIFVLYSFALCRHSKRNSVFLVVAMLHLGILTAFRGISVGVDTRQYTNAYILLCQTGSAGTHVMTTAPAFYQYMKWMAKIYPYGNGYILFTAVPTMLCLAWFLKNCAINYLDSILLYSSCFFYFNAMNTARQSLMLGVIMVSYCLIYNGKKRFGWIVFLLSCAVHSAALLFGIYILADLIKWNGKRLMAVILVIGVGMSSVPFLIQYFIQIYPQYSYLLNNIFAARYTSQGRSAIVYGAYCIIAVAIECLGIMYDEQKIILQIGSKAFIAESSDIEERNNDRQRSYELIIIVFISGCIFLFYSTSILFWRMAYTGFLFIILLLPHALNRIKWGRLFCKLLIYTPIFFMMLMQIAGDYSGVRDYIFWWK